MTTKNEIFAGITNMPAWLPDRTIYICLAGSHAYGTSTPESDIDYRGIAVPTDDYFLGYLHNFDQYVGKEVDITIFSLVKFFKLAADNNPNILELLFTAPEDRIFATEAALRLINAGDLFLSKKCKFTFSGYAISQLKRINTHYRWIRHPPDHKPTRAEFDLPETTLLPKDQLGAAETAIKKKMESWELAMDDLDEADKINLQNRVASYLAELEIGRDFEWELAARSIGYDENFLELLRREKQYRSAKSDWDKYENWKKSRNPARAELEEKFGYDTKHAMHLVRLLRMCEEILSDGIVQVKRPDAAELLEIRNGSWSYEKLIAWAEEQDAKCSKLYDTSSLPKKPKHEQLDQLCVELVRLHLEGEYGY